MAARSIWNGTVAIGDVILPVKVFPAIEDHGIHFREVRLSDGCRIVHRRVGAESGREVTTDQIAKAYETSRGHQVLLADDEIAAARGSRPKVIEIEHFVPAAQIDPIYYDRPYILGAGKGGERAYRVLRDALERTGKVGIGRFVLRTHERLVALAARGIALELYTMRFADEIVDRSKLDVPELKREPSPPELEMAARLIDTLSATWQASNHEDRYRADVLEVINRKAAGEAVTPPEREQAPSTADLLAALEQSLLDAEHGKHVKENANRRASVARGAIKSKARAR